MSNARISIRFFDDCEVRAVWDEQNARRWFSVLDFIAVLTDQYDYTKTRNYSKYLKAKLKKDNSQFVSRIIFRRICQEKHSIRKLVICYLPFILNAH